MLGRKIFAAFRYATVRTSVMMPNSCFGPSFSVFFKKLMPTELASQTGSLRYGCGVSVDELSAGAASGAGQVWLTQLS